MKTTPVNDTLVSGFGVDSVNQQESRQVDTMRLNQRFGQKLAGWMGCAVVLATQGLALAQTFPLQKIDFQSSIGGTDIRLHTGSIVPYKTVLASENKLVIDIDQVNSDQTIRTDFAEAKNVSHVILQPLSEHSIRLIVRGENLGTPRVAFKDAQPAGIGSDQFVFENKSFVKSQKTLAEKPSATIKTPTEHQTEPEAIVDDEPLAMEDETPQETLQTANLKAKDLLTHQQGFQNADNHLTADEPVNLSSVEEEPGAKAAPESKAKADKEIADFFGAGQGINSIILQVALLVGVLAGFGFFVHRKIKSIRAQESFGEDDIAEPVASSGKKSRFNDMVTAYRANQADSPPAPSSKKLGFGKAGRKEAPIGLRGLQHTGESAKKSEKPGLNNPTKKRVAPEPPAIQARPPVNPPKQMAVNQYAKQAVKPPVQPKRGIQEDLIRQEVKRSAEVKRQTGQVALPPIPKKTAEPAKPMPKMPGAKAKPMPPGNGKMGKNGPLPGNPEVLDFLRSVAELMEQDGKTGAAHRIQRNLR